MIRAAARGLLDAAGGGDFWRRFSLLADALESEAEVRYVEARRLGHLALVDRASDDGLKKVLDAIDEDTNALRRALFPYLETGHKQASQKDRDDLVALWDATFGDHNDPAVKAEIDRLARYLAS